MVILLLAGAIIPIVMQWRTNSDKIGCQYHLRSLGLIGVRHAALPKANIPQSAGSELPAGTIPNPIATAEERLSWYVWTLNVLDQGVPGEVTPSRRHRSKGLENFLEQFDSTKSWNNNGNDNLARFRLTTAICPSVASEAKPNEYSLANYIAIGGIGIDTPKLSIEKAGVKAGAYRYDSSTPDKLVTDGVDHTIQIIETNWNLGPWLQGGQATLRGLSTEDVPYSGRERQFGGCHVGGCFASMVNGSVRFVRDSTDPLIFQRLITIAGGKAEEDFEAP
jgi:hypothetical protein